MTDRYGLKRFEEAQNSGGAYARALSELQTGRKVGHWMWYVFPQIAGLGRSEMSKKYSISNLAEARAYLEHPVVGPRLLECARVLRSHHGRTAEQILGPVDAMKLRSSMTLFDRAAPESDVFRELLGQFFDGVADDATERRLAG